MTDQPCSCLHDRRLHNSFLGCEFCGCRKFSTEPVLSDEQGELFTEDRNG